MRIDLQVTRLLTPSDFVIGRFRRCSGILAKELSTNGF